MLSPGRAREAWVASSPLSARMSSSEARPATAPADVQCGGFSEVHWQETHFPSFTHFPETVNLQTLSKDVLATPAWASKPSSGPVTEPASGIALAEEAVGRQREDTS